MEGEQFNLPGPFVAAGCPGQPRGDCPYPDTTRRDRACPRLDRGALCLSGGTTGDVITSAGDD